MTAAATSSASPVATPRAAPRRAARVRVLPGLGLSLGWACGYLALLVVIPLGALLLVVAQTPWAHTWEAITAPRTLASFGLSFGAALAAAVISAPIGLLIAWVLARYRFPGRSFLDAIVDLPFALPTAVSGIALTFLYSPNGWIGSLLEPLGIQIAFTRAGIVIALIFVSIPFVIRTVQPVIEDLDPEVEEAAACLGASKLAAFRRVIFPAIAPALLTGVTLAFARSVGEYGSIVFIAGNMPMRTEIAPLLIVGKLEQFDYAGAAAVAVGMLAVSLVLLLVVNVMQRRLARHGRTR
jgi:sulfate/thiosulfate transport system permease protein